MITKRYEIAEHVLPGHPDKICDAAVDGIVDFIRRRDPDGQCGLEAACVFDRIFLTGRIASREDVLDELKPQLEEMVRDTYKSAGYGEDSSGYIWGPVPAEIRVDTEFCFGPFDTGERELRFLADDQAICIGYANHLEDTAHLPPAHWLARRIARRLHQLRAEKGAGQVGPDGKVIVRVATDGDGWTPKHVSISLNHQKKSDWLLLRTLAEEAVETACDGHGTPELELNGAGMFVSGGPTGDNGLSGKKLVVDAYGPTVPIGGGAWSGKDFHKVDRLGGLLARKLAKGYVRASLAREALVTLEYIPGCDSPVAIDAVLDGTRLRGDALSRIGTPEVGNLSVWKEFVATDADLPNLARWGHQQEDTPWE